MSDKIKELLAILDLPERALDENNAILQPQYEALYKYQEEGEYFDLPHIDCTLGGDRTNMFLADLAFRLRDDTVEECLFWDAGREVWSYCYKGGIKIPDLWTEWWIRNAKPIHWIVATLIAKELSKDTGKAGE